MPLSRDGVHFRCDAVPQFLLYSPNSHFTGKPSTAGGARAHNENSHREKHISKENLLLSIFKSNNRIAQIFK